MIENCLMISPGCSWRLPAAVLLDIGIGNALSIWSWDAPCGRPENSASSCIRYGAAEGDVFAAYLQKKANQIEVPAEALAAASGVRLRFDVPPDAIATVLRVNGREVAIFLWEPYEAEIGTWLRAGINRIELELAGSCRNLLGPHHHAGGELYMVGPDSFTDKAGWTDDNLSPGSIVYLKRFTFVRFGLAAAPPLEWTEARYEEENEDESECSCI